MNYAPLEYSPSGEYVTLTYSDNLTNSYSSMNTPLDSLCSSDSDYKPPEGDIVAIKESLLEMINGKHHEITPEMKPDSELSKEEIEIRELITKIKGYTGSIKTIQDELTVIDSRFQESVQEIQKKMKVVDNMIHFIKNNPSDIEDNPLLANIIKDMNSLSKQIIENQKIVDIKKEYALKRKQLQPYFFLINTINQFNHSNICPLCLVNPVDHFINPCGHTYCKDCLEKTMNNENPQQNNQCCFCRNQIRSTHSLYFL